MPTLKNRSHTFTLPCSQLFSLLNSSLSFFSALYLWPQPIFHTQTFPRASSFHAPKSQKHLPKKHRKLLQVSVEQPRPSSSRSNLTVLLPSFRFHSVDRIFRRFLPTFGMGSLQERILKPLSLSLTRRWICVNFGSETTVRWVWERVWGWDLFNCNIFLFSFFFEIVCATFPYTITCAIIAHTSKAL